NTHWYKQSTEPLFPDLIWSRPENKNQSGKLLIVGGSVSGFLSVAESYNESLSAGVGNSKTLLPASLQKNIGRVLDNCDFAPSNNSGSFSRKALSEWIDMSAWADGVIVVGDLGRSSETAILLESYLTKFTGLLTITKDCVDYFHSNPERVLQRPNTTIVVSIAQLQKLAKNIKWKTAITFNMSSFQLVEQLYELSKSYTCNIITVHNELTFVSCDGKISTTTYENNGSWRVSYATWTAVWWIQNPKKPFESMTTAIYAKNN
ncbi:hypothetical protein KDA00_04460, partial [Candidatus Saccharibacteria bacterium]|nr:hypothetical protein [Candidatus Saccharibacteria bacterium]